MGATEKYQFNEREYLIDGNYERLDPEMMWRIPRIWDLNTCELHDLMEDMVNLGRRSGGYWEVGSTVMYVIHYGETLYPQLDKKREEVAFGLPVRLNSNLDEFSVVLYCQGDGD